MGSINNVTTSTRAWAVLGPAGSGKTSRLHTGPIAASGSGEGHCLAAAEAGVANSGGIKSSNLMITLTFPVGAQFRI